MRDSTSNLQDSVNFFDQHYREVLDRSECQTHSVANDPMLRRTNFSFCLKDHDVTNDRLKPGKGFNS